MLYKRELKEVPLLGYCEPDGDHNHYTYTINAAVMLLEKSGNVFVGDMYRISDKAVKARFFSNGKKLLVCEGWPAERFTFRHIPGLDCYSYCNVYCSPSVDELARSFFRCGNKRKASLCDIICGMVSDYYAEKSSKTWERKYGKLQEHIEMYPDYPEDIEKYLDKYVFSRSYIFISKAEKVKRHCHCLNCDSIYESTEKMCSGGSGICLVCGRESVYRGAWYKNPMIDKEDVLFAYHIDGNRLYKWTMVKRTCYPDMAPVHEFTDFYLSLFLNESCNFAEYSYKYSQIFSYFTWIRKPNGSKYEGPVHVYSENLNDIFGSNYHNIDLSASLRGAGKIKFFSLLDNIGRYPCTEYFMKMGLTALACSSLMSKNGSRLSDFGIDKKYLPLYRQFNVTPEEHKIICSCDNYVSIGSFQKMQRLISRCPVPLLSTNLLSILEDMSFEKFCNYFHSQLLLQKYRLFDKMLIAYKDYVDISLILGCDMKRKQVRFPADLKTAHDIITERYNAIKLELIEEHFEAVKDDLYQSVSEHENSDYIIVFPKSRKDFIKEGQSLNHCVGQPSYFENHINGSRLIFFVRRTSNPGKPFVTMEVDMSKISIRQIYGFGDTSVSPEVRQFANGFVRKLQRKCLSKNIAA